VGMPMVSEKGVVAVEVFEFFFRSLFFRVSSLLLFLASKTTSFFDSFVLNDTKTTPRESEARARAKLKRTGARSGSFERARENVVNLGAESRRKRILYLRASAKRERAREKEGEALLHF